MTAERLHKENVINFLRNKTIMITGATGLIGTNVCKALICSNEKFDAGIKIVLHARDKRKLEEKYHLYLKKDYVDVVLGDIKDPILFSGGVDYIIHCASITSSRSFVENPVETIDVLVNGTMNILNFAKNKKVSGFLYLSSLEVYGDSFNEKELISEHDYRYLDFLNVRSSYPEGKRMCECLCSSFASEYHLPIFIARLSQTIGCDIDIYNDNRVFAEFARCIKTGNDIVVKTTGNTVRTYCDVSDATVALFYILSKGNVCNAYNVTNKNTLCSINDLANAFCAASNKKIKVIHSSTNDNTNGYNHEIKINLDTTKIESLGWKPLISLEKTIKNLLEGI